MIEREADMMTEPEEDSDIWSEEDYAAIDAVPPYDPGQLSYTREEVASRARKRTQAWLNAAETTTVPA